MKGMVWSGFSAAYGLRPASASAVTYVVRPAFAAMGWIISQLRAAECTGEWLKQRVQGGKHPRKASRRTNCELPGLDWTGPCSRGFHPAAAVAGRAGGARTPHPHSAAVPATRYCTGRFRRHSVAGLSTVPESHSYPKSLAGPPQPHCQPGASRSALPGSVRTPQPERRQRRRLVWQCVSRWSCAVFSSCMVLCPVSYLRGDLPRKH
jgi:hypothetical protein